MCKADNLPPSCAVVMKSGNLNFLEPFGSVQACNGTALPLPLPSPILSQINRRQALLIDLFKIHFNIALPSTSRSFKEQLLQSQPFQPTRRTVLQRTAATLRVTESEDVLDQLSDFQRLEKGPGPAKSVREIKYEARASRRSEEGTYKSQTNLAVHNT